MVKRCVNKRVSRTRCAKVCRGRVVSVHKCKKVPSKSSERRARVYTKTKPRRKYSRKTSKSKCACYEKAEKVERKTLSKCLRGRK